MDLILLLLEIVNHLLQCIKQATSINLIPVFLPEVANSWWHKEIVATSWIKNFDVSNSSGYPIKIKQICYKARFSDKSIRVGVS